MQFQTPVLVIPVMTMLFVWGKEYWQIPSLVHAYLRSLKETVSIAQVT